MKQLLRVVAFSLLLDLICGQLDVNDYHTWLVKSVCIDVNTNTALSVDPYCCPINSTMSKLSLGSALPYNNIEQTGVQISDSFPIVDKHGSTLYIHNFDYAPFNEFNQHSGSDGYDIYHIEKDVVSISNTKDGGGYGSTFFGFGCQFGNGWALFPTADFSTPAQDYWPIAGVYWEKSAQSFPGDCPGGYSTDTLTVWDMRVDFLFGGMNGNPTKSMNTLVSYHGYETSDGSTPTANFLMNGHLEVFYFTVQYGLTRWEVWTPTSSSSSESGNNTTTQHTGKEEEEHNPYSDSLKECSGSASALFKGQSFTISNCHDWSTVRLLDVPVLPVWPVVNANLLQYFHFEGGICEDTSQGMGLWHRFGSSSDGHETNWSVQTSSADGGMSYLALNCGAAIGATCGPSGSQAMYQDIPVAALPDDVWGNMLYGVNIKTTDGTGSFSLALQLLDAKGSVLWQDVVTDNAVSSSAGSLQTESIYLTVAFLSKTVMLPSSAEVLRSDVTALRFLMIPNDERTYYIVDAFVNPYPATQSVISS
jgi:hypothetical protein